MRNALLVARRDLGSYLHGLTGYFIIAAVLFIDGLGFQLVGLGGSAKFSTEVLQQFFYFCSGTTMIAAVLLTMRAIAEERQMGTDTLLHTAPIGEGEVVLGKYLAAMGMLSLLTLLSVYMPALIFVNGKVSLQHVAVGYLGLLSLGSATASIGIFGSSLFRSQLAAAVFSGVLVVAFLLCWLLSDLTNPPFTDIVAYMAFFDKHFIPFQKGQLNTSGLAFYGSVTFVFLLLSTKILEGRRWQ